MLFPSSVPDTKLVLYPLQDKLTSGDKRLDLSTFKLSRLFFSLLSSGSLVVGDRMGFSIFSELKIKKRIVLSIEDKLNYLEKPIPYVPVAPAASRAEASLDYERFSLLQRLGHPVTLGLGVSLILIGLRKEYNGFLQNYNMHSMGKTINELHAMLKLHEQTLPKSNTPALNAIRACKVQKGNKHKKSHSQTAAKGQNHGKGKNKQAYAPKPKISPSPKRENLTKNSICHVCGEIGHWKRNCPQYLAELMKKKKNTASGAGGL
nr:zinc finger, CCHC-type [Tanacetum cinerariifolium]